LGDGTVLCTFRQGETGMEATVGTMGTSQDRTRKDYKSRPGALSRFFRMSRDGWKIKYQELKATVKAYKNRIADLTKSREQWRIKAEGAGGQIAALEAKIAALRVQLAALEKKKRTREEAL
jgi:septal ring factor EnvC (AmiA/AmiB activator)